MQIHDALCRAADHIEAHPQHFNFACNLVPLHCDQGGCALGWVGFFSGEFQSPWIYPGYGIEIDAVAHQFLAIKTPGRSCYFAPIVFYARMDEICGDCNWVDNARLCALGLRAYAKMYHPRVSDAIPAAVREIFATPAAAPTF